MITIYGTETCPRCSVLKKKFDLAGIEYNYVTSIKEIRKIGLCTGFPWTKINDEPLKDQMETIKWLNKQGEQNEH